MSNDTIRRGGRRPGAGRKPTEDKRVSVTIRISQDTSMRLRSLRERGITVNAADPGVVSTGIIRMQMFFDPLTDIFFRPFIRTPRQGADTAIRLLLDEDKAGQTGTFSRSNRVRDLGEKYQHHKQRKELWERTEEIVKEYL